MSGPLAGVRVVEVVGIGPGPFAAMTLADLGADIIRVDRPGGGLSAVPHADDLLARGRPSVALDLKSERGIEVLLQLIEAADVLVEGFRPGVAERLGFGPDVALARNPRLVYGRLTGWGQDGPLAHTAGHDVNYLGVSGALDQLGRADGPPQFPINLLGDFAGGSMYLVTGVLAALLHVRGGGEGQVVDAAITDGVAHLNTMIAGFRNAGAWGGARGQNLLDSGAPFYDVYRTADDRWMALGAIEPQFWATFEATLGECGALDGQLPDRNSVELWPALRSQLIATFATRTQAQWSEVFDGTDACVAPVIPLDEAATHPQNAARGTYVERHGRTQPAPAPRFSGTPAELSTPPHSPGADTREALTAWGIGNADALIADGVAFQTD